MKPKIKACHIMLCLALIVPSCLTAQAADMRDEPVLFRSSTPHSAGSSLSHQESAWPVTINVEVLRSNPPRLAVELQGKIVRLERLGFERHTSSAFSWRGLDSAGNLSIFAAKGSLLFATLRTSTETYRVVPRNGEHWLIERQPVSSRTCMDKVSSPKLQNTGCNDPSLFPRAVIPIDLDVMTLYTPEACAVVETSPEPCEATITRIIDSYIREANGAFVDSGINLRIRSAHVGLVPSSYQETGNARLAAESARDNIEIQALRNELSADLVSVVVSDAYEDTGSEILDLCGRVIQVMGHDDINLSFAGQAYQVTVAASSMNPGCGVENLTWVHEMAHLLGANHEPNPAISPEAASFCFSFGHYNPDSSPPFRTIMGTSGPCSHCPRVRYFSDPTRRLTEPSGPFLGIDGEADNAQTLNRVALIAQDFRPRNDHFRNRTVISGDAGSADGNTTNATRETEEPFHAGAEAVGSIWFEWTAPFSNPVTFSTSGSSFDTVLTAYTGEVLAALSLVGASNEVNAGEALTFQAQAGVSYKIAVDGPLVNGHGAVHLSWDLLRAADLRVSLTDQPDPADLAQEVVYTCTLTNDGPTEATDVRLFASLDPKLVFVASEPAGVCLAQSANGFRCDLGSLASGASQELRLRALSTEVGTVALWVGVTAAEDDPIVTNNEASEWTAIELAADLAVSLQSSTDVVEAGSHFDLLLDVQNLGLANAEDTRVTVVLPANLRYLGSSPPSLCAYGAGAVTCVLGLLPPGATAPRVTLSIEALTVGAFSARADATTPTHERYLENNSVIVDITTRFPEVCSSAWSAPTIHSTSQGGAWDNRSTWIEDRVPGPLDFVEVNGPVRLAGNALSSIEVAGLIVSATGHLKENSTFLVPLTVTGPALNLGLIQNGVLDRSVFIRVRGSFDNRGTIERKGQGSVTIEAEGCISNTGTWRPFTKLAGTAPRFILGAPLESLVTVTGSFELRSSATFPGTVTVSGDVEVNAPNTLTLGRASGAGHVNGTGQLNVEVLGGTLSGNIRRVVVTGDFLFVTASFPLIEIVGVVGCRSATLTGDVIVQPGAVFDPCLVLHGNLLNKGSMHYAETSLTSITLDGNFTNSGTVDRKPGAPSSSGLSMTVGGDVMNTGILRPSTIDIQGSITNEGEWEPGSTYLSGTRSRNIQGANPLGGTAVIPGSFTLLSDAVFVGEVTISGEVVLTDSHTLSVGPARGGGRVNGNGFLRINGSYDGGLRGSAQEIRFVGSNLIRGVVDFPRIVFDGGSPSFRDLTLNGTVVVHANATLQNYTGTTVFLTRVNGALENHGAIISTNAVGSPNTFLLVVNGEVRNHGEIRGLGVSLTINGNASNSHTWFPARTTISGNIENNGTWQGTTELSGGGQRSITGIIPIEGLVKVLADMELTSSASILGEVELLTGRTVTLNHPVQLLCGGIAGDGFVNGTGLLRVKGSQRGNLAGNLPEVRFDGSGVLQGTLTFPRIFLEGSGSRIEGLVVNGDVEIGAGAVLEGKGEQPLAFLIIVNGSVKNRGTVQHPSSSGFLIVEVWGDFVNDGVIQGGSVGVRVAGDLENRGTWTNTAGAQAIWAPVTGAAGYEFNLTDSPSSWPAPVFVSSETTSIASYLTGARFWRVRAIVDGSPLGWSTVHRINPLGIFHDSFESGDTSLWSGAVN